MMHRCSSYVQRNQRAAGDDGQNTRRPGIVAELTMSSCHRIADDIHVLLPLSSKHL
jgi:hypothetical protein